MDVAERRSWAFLSRVCGGPNPQVSAAISRYGAVEVAERVGCGDIALPVFTGLDLPVRGRNELEAVERLGGRLVTPVDDEWPTQALAPLTVSRQVPIALWVLGDHPLSKVMGLRTVTIDGGTRCSDRGVRAATELTETVLGAGLGLATPASYGIGSAVLAAAAAPVAAGRPMMVVLPTGVDIEHPTANAAELRRAKAAGAVVVSEYPPATPASSFRLRARARLLAVGSVLTVAIEPSTSGGAIDIADWANRLGRTVGIVPGPLASADALGTHHLMRCGAATITNAGDLRALLKPAHQPVGAR